MRLDQALVERGLCPSREKAQRAVMAGQVKVNGHPARKSSDTIKPRDIIELVAPEKYVSRGGYKLEHALKHFALDVTGRAAIDLGASTGGFTDCLLQAGAASVHAVDVGQGQLAWKLRQDARVIVMEKTNARSLKPAAFTPPFHPFDLVVIDCSFISLTKILPAALDLVRPGAPVVALIKPQFEAGKTEVDKGEGVIRDPMIHQRVIQELQDFVSAIDGARWLGVTESPVLGPAGNKEFLALIEKTVEHIKRVGLIGNADKASCAEAVRRAAALIAKTGRKILCDEATRREAGLKVPTAPNASALSRQVDLLLVFGGDGTMLRAARETAGSRTPILGINIGGLGFLTAVSSAELEKALGHIWRKEFTFESRALLQGEVACGEHHFQATALNDLVISRGGTSRLIDLDVTVDGEPLTRYRCDGLILSSPTGSTAYALAAGGALVHPTARVMSLTPICPHTLSNRTLILPLSATVEIHVATSRPATVLSVDGELVRELDRGDAVCVRQSRRTVRLMHLAGSSFYEALRRKLHWRGTNLT